MHRAVTVAVVLAVLAGSIPAAATLADGTPSNPEPGASFAAVIGVQGAEVDNEMANRSLNQRLAAAESNSSKASVVASESQTLEARLAELETKKGSLTTAYENGTISKGQYTARLAVLSAELRAVERQANRTAETADTLPPEALQAKGTNVSDLRAIAQQANRTGGGEVAEAARSIVGGSVGNGLGKPASAGRAANTTDRGSTGGENRERPTDAGQPENVTNNRPADTRVDGEANGSNASENRTQGATGNPGRNNASTANQTANERGNATNGSDNRPNYAGNSSARPGNSSAANGSDRNETNASTSTMVAEEGRESPNPDNAPEQWADQFGGGGDRVSRTAL